MTLTISILALMIYYWKNQEQHPLFCLFYFFFPLLSYIDITYFGLGSTLNGLQPFWILTTAALAIGVGQALDIFVKKRKVITEVPASIAFLGLCSLFKQEYYLIAVAILVLFRAYGIWEKRGGYPADKTWVFLVVLFAPLRACMLGGEQWLTPYFASLATVFLFFFFLISGNFKLVLGAWALILFSTEYWELPHTSSYILSFVLFLITLFSSSLTVKTWIGEKLGGSEGFRRVEYFFFHQNNPSTLRPELESRESRALKKKTKYDNAIAEENILGQQLVFFLFLCFAFVGIAVWGN